MLAEPLRYPRKSVRARHRDLPKYSHATVPAVAGGRLDLVEQRRLQAF